MPPLPNPPEKLKPEVDPKADVQIAADAPAAAFIQNLISARPPKQAAPPEESPKPAPKPKKKAPAPPPAPVQVIDEEKLGESIGKSIAAHTQKPDAAPDPKKETPKGDEKEERMLTVLQRMEELNGERYKGLGAKFRENKQRLQQYAAEWEKSNPGETFDENADEHTDFIESLESQVAYEDHDYIEALADLRSEQRIDSKKTELEKRIANVERAEKARSEGRNIHSAAVAAGNTFWTDMGDDFKGVVDDAGEINVTTLKALEAADPDRYRIVLGAAESAERKAQVIYVLAHDLESFNPSDPYHRAVVEFAVDAEKAFLKMPAEDRADDEGRSFAPKQEYDRMNPKQRERHWTFSPEEITMMVVHSESKRAKEQLKSDEEKFQRRAKARGLLREDQSSLDRTHVPLIPHRLVEEDDTDDTVRTQRSKPISPTAFTSPKLAVKPGANANDQQNGLTRFVSKFLS